MLEVTAHDTAVEFQVRVLPRARRDAIEGTWGGALKVRLTAPPVDGRANLACCRLLAQHLNIPLSAVRIIGGERSRTKRIEVRGVTAQRLRELLLAPPR